MKLAGILASFDVGSGCGGCCVQLYDRLTSFVCGHRVASASAIVLIARQKLPEPVPSSLLICSSSRRPQLLPPSFGEIYDQRGQHSCSWYQQQTFSFDGHASTRSKMPTHLQKLGVRLCCQRLLRFVDHPLDE
jgi:hypothetical protein